MTIAGMVPSPLSTLSVNMHESNFRHVSVENTRQLMEGDGFVKKVAGKVVSIPVADKLLRALALAAEYGHLQLAESLVNEGADIGRAVDALVAAAEKRQVPVLKFLLAAGVPVDLRDEMFSATALMSAAGSGAVESVQVLLAFGADPNAKDREGKTPLAWAKMGLDSGCMLNAMSMETKWEKAEVGFRQVMAILESTGGRA